MLSNTTTIVNEAMKVSLLKSETDLLFMLMMASKNVLTLDDHDDVMFSFIKRHSLGNFSLRK